MKIKIFISFVLIYNFLFNQVFAEILFSEMSPNTTDDKNLEYIELYNSGVLDKSLSGFVLKDKSEKEFIFGSGEILKSFSFKKYFRSITSILLNNTGDELYLYNGSGVLEDSFSYTGTIKGEVIKIIDFSTLSYVNTGEILIESGVIENTGAIIFSSGNLINSSGNILVDSGSVLSNSGILSENTGSILDNSGVIVFSGGIENNFGEILTQTGIVISSGIIEDNSGFFLEEDNNNFNLKFSFQNPSYILEKEKILEKYICDNSKKQCKINLDLRDSFSGSFKEKDYVCNIDFGFDGWISGEENKCNPSTIIFPKGSYDLKFKIIEKSNTGNIFTGGFILENKIEPEIIEKEIIKEIKVEKIIEKDNCVSGGIIGKIENKIEIQKPKIIIQSGLDKNNNCKKENCSINLKYEEKDKLEKCEWDFSGGVFKGEINKKCNPGYVKYPLGNFSIILKVYEKNNKNNYKESVLNFSNIKKEKISKKGKSKIVNNFLDEENIKTNTGTSNKNNILRYIKFGNININPKGKDDNEYVELINYSSGKINLSGCYLDDILEKGSKKYIFKNDYFLERNEIKKIYKKETKIIFNNNSDEVNLICDGNLIDKIKWDFTIKEEYILNNEKLIVRNKIEEINKKIKANRVENDLNMEVLTGKEKIYSNESKIYSDENKIKNKLEANIIVQGKIGTNKILKGNTLTCFNTCSINFDGSKSIGDIEKYVWDFGNGEKYEGKNPGYIKYKKLGKYSVVLTIYDKNNLENKTNFLVDFKKEIKTKRLSKTINFLKNNKKDIVEIKDKKDIDSSDLNTEVKNNTKVEILLYILLFIFSLNLVVFLLKKEKLL